MDENKELILKEIKGCFDFFWNESNSFVDSTGYGLTADMTGKNLSSIAAIGFSLSAYVIGVKQGFISFEQGYERTEKVLNNVITNVSSKRGFFVHFMKQENAEDLKRTEYSTIDTALFLAGAIVSGEFFSSNISVIVDSLVQATEWEYLVIEKQDKKFYRMAFSDDHWLENNGWCPACWDHYAEHLLMYFLHAGKDNVDEELVFQLYSDFKRHVGKYKGNDLIYCYGNALFIHQFTHAYFDFSKYLDSDGVNWHQNSIDATTANKEFSLINIDGNKPDSWGLTAMMTNDGYRVFGAPPYDFEHPYNQEIDGSIAPYASLCSINFTPEDSLAALNYFQTLNGLDGKYGLYDSYRFINGELDICKRYLGIDKGPTIIMLENYLSGCIWDLFMNSKYIKKAIKVLKYNKTEERK